MKLDHTLPSIICSFIFTGSTLFAHGQLDDQRGGDAPINDECTGAVAQDLFIGETIFLSGNNTGANLLAGTPFVVVWEAFTLDECATIRIEHCVADFEFTSFISDVTNTCPDVFAGSVTADEIAECQLTYNDLGPGTWYIPVIVDENFSPVGDYTIHVTALECDPPYCMADGGSQEHTGQITGVSLGTLEYTGPASDLGYVDHTTETAYVGTGLSHGITITLDDSQLPDGISETAQLLVWIDFDQNGEFTDPGELVYISADPFEGLTHTGIVNVPPTATLGTTRMRIRLHDTHDGSEYANEPNNTPCGSSTFGQVYDFSVDVDLGTSIPDQASHDLRLFPNPGDGELTLLVPGSSGHITLEVVDNSGRLMHRSQPGMLDGAPLQLSFREELGPGSYLLVITNERSRITQRFVIQ